jgi:hypothetical protein
MKDDRNLISKNPKYKKFNVFFNRLLFKYLGVIGFCFEEIFQNNVNLLKYSIFSYFNSKLKLVLVQFILIPSKNS